MKTITGSFRGVKFHCEANKLEFGRRVALHEFPQYDKPFSQDMGRAQFKYQIPCYIIGTDWKKQRDDLITACSTKGVGKLIHPQFGELLVQPGSCSCVENHQQSYGRVDFDLVFYETVETNWKAIKVSARSNIQKSAFARIVAFAGACGTIFNKLTNLPEYAASYCSTITSQLMGGISFNQITKAVTAYQNLIKSDITLTKPYLAQITQVTAALNNDYSGTGTELYIDKSGNWSAIDPDLETATNKITAVDAVKMYDKIINTSIPFFEANSDATQLQAQCGTALELYIKAVAVVEQSVAVSNMEIDNLTDAQRIWTSLLDNYDTLIDLAATMEDDTTYIELRKHRALVVADISARAPSLAELIYFDIDSPTSSLVLAWEQYADTSRASEVIARNNIVHPSFVQGHNMEFLNV